MYGIEFPLFIPNILKKYDNRNICLTRNLKYQSQNRKSNIFELVKCGRCWEIRMRLQTLTIKLNKNGNDAFARLPDRKKQQLLFSDFCRKLKDSRVSHVLQVQRPRSTEIALRIAEEPLTCTNFSAPTKFLRENTNKSKHRQKN